jgi:iron-sulfur cluster repair protein YtfE (RIC family)
MLSDESRPRPDIASMIHKAVRKVLFDHAMLLARVDFRSPEAARDAHVETMHVFSALREHAQHEDDIVWPALRDAPLMAEALRQHEELETEMYEIERLASLAVVATTLERPDVGSRLRGIFYDFVAAQLAHLAYEERVLMPALWKTHSDEQLMALHLRIRASQAPDRGLAWRNLLLASVDASERAALGA